MNTTIFKAGRTIGPLNRESVRGMLARGEVSEYDLGQPDGAEDWLPLRQLFPPKRQPTRLEKAVAYSRRGARDFWSGLHSNPARSGLASLVVCCLLIIYPQWTFLLFLPALAAAVFAGAILLTRRRFLSGGMLSVSALAFPALFLLAGRAEPVSGKPELLLGSPMIQSVIARKPAKFAKPTPFPTHHGVALPLPVKPTPAPRQPPAI